MNFIQQFAIWTLRPILVAIIEDLNNINERLDTMSGDLEQKLDEILANLDEAQSEITEELAKLKKQIEDNVPKQELIEKINAIHAKSVAARNIIPGTPGVQESIDNPGN